MKRSRLIKAGVRAAVRKGKPLGKPVLALFLSVIMFIGSFSMLGGLSVFASEEEVIGCNHQHIDECYELIPMWKQITPGHTHTSECYIEGNIENGLVDSIEDIESEDKIEWIALGEGEPDKFINSDSLICSHKDCASDEVCKASSDNQESKEIPKEEIIKETSRSAEDTMGIMGDFPASSLIESISVNTNYSNDYRTYILGSSSGDILPPILRVSLLVNINENYESGGVIKLPLNFIPKNSTHPDFTYGTNGTDALSDTMPPFFIMKTPVTNDRVESFDLTTEPGVLIINLKDITTYGGNMGGAETIILDFDFNLDWNGKIPSGTVLWDISPSAFVEEEPACTAPTKTITGNASTTINVGYFMGTPSDRTKYLGGVIGFNPVFNTANYRALILDPTETVTQLIWVDVPTNATFNNGGVYTLSEPSPDPEHVGYTRYYRYIGPDGSLYDDWGWLSPPNDLHSYNGITMTPEAGTCDNENDTFTVYWGVIYKHINSPTIYTPSNKMIYVRTILPIWELTANKEMQVGHSLPDFCGIYPGVVGRPRLGPVSTHTNSGQVSITGVRMELYQDEDIEWTGLGPSPRKIDFNSIIISFGVDALGKSIWPDYSYYKVYYEIAKYDTSATREVPIYWDSSNDGGSPSFIPTGKTELLKPKPPTVTTENNQRFFRNYVLPLPTLNNGEYISKIIVVPYGIDGSVEREWPTGNYMTFSSSSTPRMWISGKWLDGSSPEPMTFLPFSSKLYYDDNPLANWNVVATNKKTAMHDDYPVSELRSNEIFQLDTGYVCYTNAPYPSATIIRNDSVPVLSGDTVDYTIYGYNFFVNLDQASPNGNDTNKVAYWLMPKVIIRVSDCMEVTGLEGKAVGTSITLPDNTVVTLEGSGGGFNYYSFQYPNDVYRTDNNSPVFNIPVQFTLKDTTKPGNYTFNVLVSCEDDEIFLRSRGEIDNLPLSDNKTNYGVSTDGHYWMVPNDGYGGVPIAVPLTVTSIIRVAEKTSIKNEMTGNVFVDSSVVYANENSDVYMKLTIKNTGSATLNKIKLYDILPYAGDNLGSTGSITFEGIESITSNALVQTLPSIQYTTTTQSALVSYGSHTGATNPDLQSFPGFSTTVPGDITKTTAIQIYFGTTTELEPGDWLEIVLKFHVPESANQNAFNQFRYSVVDKNISTVINNLNSPVSGFSTEAISVIYNGNAPSGAGTPKSIPATASAIRAFSPAIDHFSSGVLDSFQISSTVPSLTGYTFIGWNTNADGTGAWWGNIFPSGKTGQGDWKQFSSGGSLPLYAQWVSDDVIVNFFNNYSSTDNTHYVVVETANTDKKFGETIDIFDEPERTGYVFDGWFDERIIGTEYVPGTDIIDVRDTLNLYAHWTVKAVTVIYKNNYEAGDTSEYGTLNSTYDSTLAFPGEPTAPSGYTFGGWYKQSNTINPWYFTNGNNGIPTVTGTTLSLTIANGLVEIVDANTPYALTLYAKWVKDITYTVIYNGNGNTRGTTPTDSNSPYLSGSTVTVKEKNGLVREGYSFTGWNTKADGTGTLYKEGDTFTISNDTVLYAQWKEDPKPPVTYIVAYNGNGNTGGAAPIDGTSYSNGNEVIVLSSGSLVKSGYSFSGWGTNPGGPKVYDAGSKFNITGNTTLYAQWSEIIIPVVTTYTVRYLPGTRGTFNTVAYGLLESGVATPGAPAVTGQTGYTFAGWSPVRSATVTGNIDYVAQWTLTVIPTTYTVRYLPGTRGTFQVQSTSGLSLGDNTPAAPSATPGENGYTFTGWSPTVSATVTGNVDYVAQWEGAPPVDEDEYLTVRFVDFDGRLIKEERVVRGGDATAPASPTRAGYTFTDWDRGYTNVQENITVTAQYRYITTVTPLGEPSNEEIMEMIKEEGVPTINLGGLEIPLTAGSMSKYVWALLNLILTVLGILFALIATIRSLIKKRNDDDNEEIQNYYEQEKEEETRKTRILWLVITIVMAVVGLVVFLLTENMKLPMVLTDKWTILNAIIFIIGFISFLLISKRNKEEEEDKTGQYESTSF